MATAKQKQEWFAKAKESGIIDKLHATEKKHGLPTGILVGLAEQESDYFDPTVLDGTRKSPAGAEGIMQFMPATSKDEGVDPYNLDSAIDGGGAYLAKMIKSTGSLQDGLTAYNWGIGNVNNYKSGIRKDQPDEARDYARAVTSKATKFGYTGEIYSGVINMVNNRADTPQVTTTKTSVKKEGEVVAKAIVAPINPADVAKTQTTLAGLLGLEESNKQAGAKYVDDLTRNQADIKSAQFNSQQRNNNNPIDANSNISQLMRALTGATKDAISANDRVKKLSKLDINDPLNIIESFFFEPKARKDAELANATVNTLTAQVTNLVTAQTKVSDLTTKLIDNTTILNAQQKQRQSELIMQESIAKAKGDVAGATTEGIITVEDSTGVTSTTTNVVTRTGADQQTEAQRVALEGAKLRNSLNQIAFDAKTAGVRELKVVDDKLRSQGIERTSPWDNMSPKLKQVYFNLASGKPIGADPFDSATNLLELKGNAYAGAGHSSPEEEITVGILNREYSKYFQKADGNAKKATANATKEVVDPDRFISVDKVERPDINPYSSLALDTLAMRADGTLETAKENTIEYRGANAVKFVAQHLGSVRDVFKSSGLEATMSDAYNGNALIAPADVIGILSTMKNPDGSDKSMAEVAPIISEYYQYVLHINNTKRGYNVLGLPKQTKFNVNINIGIYGFGDRSQTDLASVSGATKALIFYDQNRISGTLQTWGTKARNVIGEILGTGTVTQTQNLLDGKPTIAIDEGLSRSNLFPKTPSN